MKIFKGFRGRDANIPFFLRMCSWDRQTLLFLSPNRGPSENEWSREALEEVPRTNQCLCERRYHLVGPGIYDLRFSLPSSCPPHWALPILLCEAYLTGHSSFPRSLFSSWVPSTIISRRAQLFHQSLPAHLAKILHRALWINTILILWLLDFIGNWFMYTLKSVYCVAYRHIIQNWLHAILWSFLKKKIVYNMRHLVTNITLLLQHCSYEKIRFDSQSADLLYCFE